MKINNQEKHKLGMHQIIIADDITGINFLALTTEGSNNITLESMYRVQDQIYHLFGKCDIRETQANTINPAQQNIFIPLKVWNVNLGECFAEIRIQQRVFDGCFAEMLIL